MSTSLLAALTQENLRDSVFPCWAAMLLNFTEEDSELLLETTFFMVSQYWSTLKSDTKVMIKDMLDDYIERHEHIVAKYANRLPNLTHIPALRPFNKKLDTLREDLLPEEALEVFAQRIGHEKSGVVHLALKELTPFLRETQGSLYTPDGGQRSGAAIATILRALLDCVSKYNGTHVDIARLCAECMGLIGCLDSNQIETVRQQRSIVILSNFNGSEEPIDFALFCIEEVLVPSFLGATDTRLQGFLSFVVQQLLERTGITQACKAQGTGMSDGDDKFQKWLSLPESTREVITPFLDSKYKAAPMPFNNLEYPIYRAGKPYNNWLRFFVLDLLHKGQCAQADMIFEPLMRVIRVRDVSIAEFLLPYLFLHVLLGSRSSEADKALLATEALHVLQIEAEEDSAQVGKEDAKRYYQVCDVKIIPAR